MATNENEDDGRFSGSSGQESSSSSSDSESDEEIPLSGSDSDESMWEYGQALTAVMFRNNILPSDKTLKELFALTDSDTFMTSPHLRSDGTRAREILCRADFQIRGRILWSRPNVLQCSRTGPYLARRLLIDLRRLMCDRTRSTMTYSEVHASHIGTTLTGFKAQLKLDLINWEITKDDLHRHAYSMLVDHSKQAILDIDSITKLLVELVTDNGADNYGVEEGLELPESEPVDDDDGINDEDEESSDSEGVDAFASDETWSEPE
jgi:hypothetical protein